MYDAKFIYQLVRFGYTVPNLPKKPIFNLYVFYFLDFVASQTPSLPSQPGHSMAGLARPDSGTVPNLFTNWTDSGIWYQQLARFEYPIQKLPIKRFSFFLSLYRCSQTISVFYCFFVQNYRFWVPRHWEPPFGSVWLPHCNVHGLLP